MRCPPGDLRSAARVPCSFPAGEQARQAGLLVGEAEGAERQSQRGTGQQVTLSQAGDANGTPRLYWPGKMALGSCSGK